MNYLIELLVSGLAVGAVYGLIAMSFAIIFKATGLLNFAQGEMGMITAYVAFSIASATDGNPWLTAAGAIVFSVLFALAVERIVIRPMVDEPILARIMTTIGLAVIFRSGTMLVWDALPHDMGLAAGSALVDLGGVRVRGAQIGVVVALAVAVAAMLAFFR